jgi:hypothetical protein
MLPPDRPGFALVFPLSGKKKPLSAQAKQSAVRQFVARVGGLANARQALELLVLLEDAPERRKAG